MRYRAVFFDADDTLFDYPSAERASLLACHWQFAVPGDEEEFVAAYRRHNHDVWRAFERGEMDQATLRVERFRRLAGELGLAALPLERISAFYLEELSSQAQLLSGALELVQELAGSFPLGLITNGIASVQRRRFAASPILAHFKAVVISEEVGIAKPDPRIFAPALEAIGVSAGDVLFVGDSVTSDMAAARNAGMDFCWLNPRGAAVPEGYAPAYIIASLAEFPRLSKQ